MRGDYVDIPLVRGDSEGCVGIPLSKEVIVGCDFVPYPSSVRLIVVWLSAYPSKCRGDYVVPCLLCRGCIG